MKTKFGSVVLFLLSATLFNWAVTGVSWAGEGLSAGAKNPTQNEIQRARALFDRGKVLFMQGKYREAANAFEEAYRLHKHKAIAYNLAVTHAMLGQDRLAVKYLRIFLRHEKRPPPLPEVLRKAQSRVGVVVVSVGNTDGVIFVNGRPVGRGQVEKVVEPGKVVLDVRVGHRVVAHKEIMVFPGRETVYEFAAISKPSARPGRPGQRRDGRGAREGTGDFGRRSGAGKSFRRLHWAYFSVAAAVTLGLAAGAVATSVMAKQTYDDYQEDLSDSSLRERGVRLVKTTNILWGATAGMAVTTVILAIFTKWKGNRAREGETVTAAPVMLPGGGGVLVTVRR